MFQQHMLLFCLKIIAGLIPQSLQLQGQVTLASLGGCHMSGECAKSCARR